MAHDPYNSFHIPGRLERDFERKPVRTSIKIGIGIITIFVAIAAVLFLLNPFWQAGQIVNKTIDADNVIYNYEWFHQQYQDIKAIDEKIVVQEKAKADFEASAGPRADWRFEERQEWNRLNTYIAGLKSQRAQMVATYNARAAMSNRSIFIGRDLPDHID